METMETFHIVKKPDSVCRPVLFCQKDSDFNNYDK